MRQALLVTVRLHEGRYHGTGDWPPAPARLFQAMMAGSANGANIPSDIREAFDWFERLPPPVIAAPRGTPGQAFTAFVPNNDLDAELPKGKTPNLDRAVAAIRVGKHMRPMLFDAKSPILYCWSIDNDRHASALRRAADGLFQLGRGSDMAWAKAAVLAIADAEEMIASHGGVVHRPSDGAGKGSSLLCPRPGTQDSLIERFKGMRDQVPSRRNKPQETDRLRAAAQAAAGQSRLRNPSPPSAFPLATNRCRGRVRSSTFA